MIIKKHETYQFEETTSKDDEPAKRVSAERTVHEIRDTEKGTFDSDCDTKFGLGSELELSPTFNQLIQSQPDTIKNQNKVYLPSKESMDFDQLIQQSTGKKYSSSWFYGDSSKNPYPTIEEQVKLCRKIASQLVDDENRKSKGASMFFKRLKRSQKWIHEGNQQNNHNDSNSSSSSQSDSINGSNIFAEEEVQRMKQELKSESIPRLKLILDPREVLSLEKLRKLGDIVEHNMVSPDICHNLVKDLNSPEANKGAQIFLKRKQKSQEWVVDENSCSAQLREKKREKELKMQEENAQKEWLAKKQREKMVELEQLENIKRSLPKIQLVKSPWEACLEGKPVDQAFHVLAPKTKQLEPINQDRTKLKSINSNQFIKNFKNFNRNPRGWGTDNQEQYNEQRWNTFETTRQSPMPPTRSPQSSLSHYSLPEPEFELPRSYTVMEELKLSKPKCAEFGLPSVSAVQGTPQSILKTPQKTNINRSATVNFKFDDHHYRQSHQCHQSTHPLPVKHFDLKSLNLGPTVNLPKFQNFNSVPKKWSNQPITYL